MKTIGQRFRHLRRYQEVAQILVRHGFGEIVELFEEDPLRLDYMRFRNWPA